MPTQFNLKAAAPKPTIHQEQIIADLLSCEWNTFMCCWTGNVTDISDVCRVLDFPGMGDVLEMPRDDEGNVSW